MRLNHANIVTGDVAALAGFLTRHFGFELIAMRGRDAFAILRGEDGFDLNLMKPGKDEPACYPDGWHIGFVVRTGIEVAAKHAELEAAGAVPGAVQRLSRGGAATTTFYCRAPGDLLVEVRANAS
jgi:catechol 2,3-dioxygenase-like lactoylglutathione lyase family enzyme